MIALGAGVACSGTPAREPTAPVELRASLAIVNVNVVPMDAERVMTGQTVLIDEGRIVAIGPASTIAPAAGAQIIDGRGGYLLPGLIDMHVHIRSHELQDYLKGGITTVRNMWGYRELPALVAEIERDARTGPRILSLTAGFDASPATWPQTQLSDDPGAIAALIQQQYDQGFREVKVYQKLSRAAYDTIVAIAKRNRMTFAGHRPQSVPLEHVLASGQRSIEHLGGYAFGGAQLAAQVEATVRAGTYNCPTMAIQAGLSPGEWTEGRRAAVGALHRAGAKLLVGTDSGIGRTMPGTSIGDELEHFVGAGLTPFEALLGATRTAAEYLGLKDEIGTIDVGHHADLLLIRSNPLEDVGAVRDVRLVVQRGRTVYSASE